MRFVGIVGIFILCSLGGMYFGQMGKRKIEFYQELKRILLLIKGEIRYGITPIGDACTIVSKKSEGVCKEFLVEIAKLVNAKSESDFTIIWRKASENILPKEFFSKNEWQQFIQIGSSMGYLDLTMQMKNIDLLMEQVDRSLVQARVRQERDGKMYQTLGIGIGLMFVIVLI